MLVCALQSLFIYSATIIPLSGRVGDRLTINAPSSTISNAPDLYSVQWSVINGDKDCISLVNATSRTVAVNIIKEGKVRIQCKCEFYNSSNPGYGKGTQSTFYDITCTNSGGSGGGGGNSGGGFGDGSLVVPNPTVGEGWKQYNNYNFYCAENTEEGIPMRFTQINQEDRLCQTFSWQDGEAVCINPNTMGKVTIPAEVNEYSVRHIGKYSFYNCNKLIAVVIPNTVTIIKAGAFRGCSSLTTVTIPESVVEIGLWAFRDCKSLKSITCLAENPPSVSDVFNGTQKEMTLYVLKGRKEIYEKWWTVWNEFKEIKEMEESFDITTSAAGYATFYQ